MRSLHCFLNYVAIGVYNSTYFHTPLVFVIRIPDHKILRCGSASAHR